MNTSVGSSMFSSISFANLGPWGPLLDWTSGLECAVAVLLHAIRTVQLYNY